MADLKIFFWVLDISRNPFPVDIGSSETVRDLAKAIIRAKPHTFKNVEADELFLWKVLIPAERIKDELRASDFKHETSLLSMIELSTIFADPPSMYVHVVVRAPPTATIRPSTSDDSSLSKRSFDEAFARKWSVNGAVRPFDLCYYLDPAGQSETQRCLNAVSNREVMLLTGARSSGKTTRLFRIRSLLQDKGYQCLYVSLERLSYQQFWRSLPNAIRLGDDPLELWSQEDFYRAFASGGQKGPVVLLIDELSKLYSAPDGIRNDFLETLREIRNNNSAYAIHSVIASGTFSILHLSTTDTSLSPFNVASSIQNPYFTVEETRQLFHMFMQDNNIVVEDAVIQDVWAKSNGHPGMDCLCGRLISDRLNTLVDHDSRILSYHNWRSIPIEVIYDEITAHNTFSSMIRTLHRPEAEAAVKLLRSNFAGFLDLVTVSPFNRTLADFLTAEGVLSKPNVTQPQYCMASPLIDGLIRTRVIPVQFPVAPSMIPPTQSHTNALHIINVLIESIKHFDKDLIRSACDRSYKRANVPVGGQSHQCVPRESVYDTELMRILACWLSRLYAWTVTGQWRLQTAPGKHKYTDIILQKGGNPPIVLEVLATGDPLFVRSYIEKTPDYLGLPSSSERWVVHFTCQDNYYPIWQSDAQLEKGVNVVHFAHNVAFTQVMMLARWKNDSSTILDTYNLDI